MLRFSKQKVSYFRALALLVLSVLLYTATWQVLRKIQVKFEGQIPKSNSQI